MKRGIRKIIRRRRRKEAWYKKMVAEKGDRTWNNRRQIGQTI